MNSVSARSDSPTACPRSTAAWRRSASRPTRSPKTSPHRRPPRVGRKNSPQSPSALDLVVDRRRPKATQALLRVLIPSCVSTAAADYPPRTASSSPSVSAPKSAVSGAKSWTRTGDLLGAMAIARVPGEDVTNSPASAMQSARRQSPRRLLDSERPVKPLELLRSKLCADVAVSRRQLRVLALNNDQRNTLVGHLDRMRVPQLVRGRTGDARRQERPSAGVACERQRAPNAPAVALWITQSRAPTGKSARISSHG
jgi:hypothetical protein